MDKIIQNYTVRLTTIGYENDSVLDLKVFVDAKKFRALDKKDNALAAIVPQIKNNVFDAFGVVGHPIFQIHSYKSRYGRARDNTLTLHMWFNISEYKRVELTELELNVLLNKVLNETRQVGHLFAKTAIASKIAN